MANGTVRLLAGVLLFAGAALVLLGSLLLTVDVPAPAYALVALALFGAVSLIGLSSPDRTI